MDVLLLSGNFTGGVAKVCYQLAKGLPADITPTLAHLGGENNYQHRFDEQGVESVCLGETELSLATVRNLDLFLRKRSFDVVHTHMLTGGLVGRPLAALHGVPSVHTVHTEFGNRSAAAKYLDVAAAPFGDQAVCVSNAVADSLPGYYASPTTTIRNCIDVERIGSDSYDTHPFDGTDITAESPTIVNIARADPLKRRVDLLDAFKSVVAEYPDSQLVLTGDKTETMSRLGARAQAYGLRENVEFIGFVSNTAALNRMADVVVFCSESEGFSLSLLEAMAHGRPVIATDIPAFIEALGPDYPGVAPVHAPEQLAAEILHALSDDQYRVGLARHIEQRIGKFASPKAAHAYARIYRSLVDSE